MMLRFVIVLCLFPSFCFSSIDDTENGNNGRPNPLDYNNRWIVTHKKMNHRTFKDKVALKNKVAVVCPSRGL